MHDNLFNDATANSDVIYKVAQWIGRDGSVSKVTGYGLDDRIRFPLEAKNFSLYHHILTGYGIQPASYLMRTRGKAAEEWK
jgi:hypothetical protein